jgi:REP element-mobilizing transposase RayT
MPSTYSQIYIQIVFAVKYRQSLICPYWEDSLYKYISGVIKQKEQKLISINGMPDHLHLFIGMKPTCILSDLVREVKKSSTKFVNDNKLSSYPFNWQEGFGAFSYSHSQIEYVAKYILNQKEHHKKQSFKSEYIELLNKFNIEYKSEYLFDWIT